MRNEPLKVQLPASWLATRVGADREELDQRVGLTGGGRMVDLLFQGDGRRVIAEIQAAT